MTQLLETPGAHCERQETQLPTDLRAAISPAQPVPPAATRQHCAKVTAAIHFFHRLRSQTTSSPELALIGRAFPSVSSPDLLAARSLKTPAPDSRPQMALAFAAR